MTFAKYTSYNKIGVHYHKYDIDRCGLFAELGFIQGEKYINPHLACRVQGKNFLCGVTPTKCGIYSKSGYFDEEFRRLSFCKSYTKGKLTTGKKWAPVGPTKWHATPGDYFGTFSGSIKAFSPLQKKQKSFKESQMTFVTNPGKKGGPGYIDITLGKYPKYIHEKKIKSKITPIPIPDIQLKPMHLAFSRLPYFDDNPWMGNKLPTYQKKKMLQSESHFYGGGPPNYLNKFPEWMPDKRKIDTDDEFVRRPFRPVGHNKKYYSDSIILKNIKFRCNNRTKETLRPITYPQYNVKVK